MQKNGPYSFEICQSFWDHLDTLFREEMICSTLSVYKELLDYKDELAEWAKDRKEFFIEPDREIQNQYSIIVDSINQNLKYSSAQKSLFLSNADPWVIAHAKTRGLIVVTSESKVSEESKKIKIPNICTHFDTKYCNLYSMLQELNIKLELFKRV
jgi:hypothetical protein